MRSLYSLLLVLFSFVPTFHVNASDLREIASTVYVDFTSLGAGVDRNTVAQVRAEIAEGMDRRAITEFKEFPYGREGEVLVCVRFEEAQSSREMIRHIAPSILHDREVVGRQRTFVRLGVGCSEGQFKQATEQDLEEYQNL